MRRVGAFVLKCELFFLIFFFYLIRVFNFTYQFIFLILFITILIILISPYLCLLFIVFFKFLLVIVKADGTIYSMIKIFQSQIIFLVFILDCLGTHHHVLVIVDLLRTTYHQIVLRFCPYHLVVVF